MTRDRSRVAPTPRDTPDRGGRRSRAGQRDPAGLARGRHCRGKTKSPTGLRRVKD